MTVAVIGTGFIGTTLGRAWASAGETVCFGSRHPDAEASGADAAVTVKPIEEAIATSDVVVLAVPGNAVAELTAQHAAALAGKLVVDATNKMGSPVANARAELPSGVRYVRAFNTLGGENFADPDFSDGPADLFFSAPEDDRSTVETLIEEVGLRPIYLGADEEDLVDALFRLWITLAVKQSRGRRLALRLLEQ